MCLRRFILLVIYFATISTVEHRTSRSTILREYKLSVAQYAPIDTHNGKHLGLVHVRLLILVPTARIERDP
jgi:hypothetical protein